MEMKKLIGLMSLLAVVSIGLVIASYTGFIGNVAVTSIPVGMLGSSGQELHYGSSLCVYYNDELVFCKPNVLTYIGGNHTKDRLIGQQIAPHDYIAIGNSTAVSATMAALAGEIEECGLSRTQDTTYANVDTGNWSYSIKFTSSCDGILVNTTALFNNTKAGESNAFAAANFSSDVNMQNNDELNVTWYVFVVES